uniref:Proteasome assembly chaperone 1 n=1 Tax=Amphimedon queenslandica TaxID=400682 RepID=A0A1X7V1B4_AMPQE
MDAGGLSLDHYSVPQRHVFYESEEEEEENEEQDNLFVIDAPTALPNVKLLVLCTTEVGGVFMKSHVTLEPQPLLNIDTCCPEKVLKDCYFHQRRDRVNETVGELYRVKGKEDAFVYVQLKSLKDEHCNQWSRMLIDATRPDTVIILHSSLLHQYYHTEDEELDEEEEVEGEAQFLKCLQTRSWSDKPLTSLLSSNNIITGEAAAAMSLCQYASVPASIVVQYFSSSLTLKERAKGWRPLFSHPLLSQSVSLVSLGVANKNLHSLTLRKHSDLDTLYT